MKHILVGRVAFSTIFLAVGSIVSAQETGPKVILKNAEGVDKSKGTGWHPHLKVAGNMALGQSKNTPGTPDGVSLQLGYIIGANLDYLSPSQKHEWANALGLELAYTRTPVVDAFVKSVDRIDFRSAYLFHIPRVPWLGPFLAFRLSTPMLPAYLVRAEPTNVYWLEVGAAPEDTNGDGVLEDEDGVAIDVNHPEVTTYQAGRRIKLTKELAPLTIRESAGLFAIPIDKPWLKLDARLGFGAWETFVRNGFVVEDNGDTADIFELRRMQDSVQLGPELGVILTGAVKENLTYSLSALLMQPVYHNAETGLNGSELLNVELEAKLGVKVTKYVSIDYSFKAYRQPLIVDEWQIQNNLLVSIGFELPAPPAPTPACPPAPPCPECPAAPTPDAISEPEPPTAPPKAPSPAPVKPESETPAPESQSAPGPESEPTASGEPVELAPTEGEAPGSAGKTATETAAPEAEAAD